MSIPLRFLVMDGYPKPSRDQFEEVGMRLAGILYRDMLLKYLPDAQCDIWYTSDDPKAGPADEELKRYAGVLWPGCNLTVYHDDPRVHCHLALADRAYAAGRPQFGSCWAIQVAVHVAGGRVEAHPGGREMGVARNIHLADGAAAHPMFAGKPPVYSHFVSHDDYVTELPPGSVLLSGNAFCPVQAAAVQYKQGEFWGVQYHPEYDLHEMARLITAREPRLVKQGLFRDHDDLVQYVERLEALFAEPARKDLQWQLGIDEHLLDDAIRQREFINWLNTFILPQAGLCKPPGLV